MNKFEEKIVVCLETVVEEWKDKKLLNDTMWTKRIKELIIELGYQKGYKACASGTDDSTMVEWLYDICLYKEENIDGLDMLVEIPLIVESEWSRSIGSIKYDFEKLLQSNATTRLMICQARANKILSLQKYFRQAIQSYRFGHSGDRYLIAILDDYDSGKFIVELIIKE